MEYFAVVRDFQLRLGIGATDVHAPAFARVKRGANVVGIAAQNGGIINATIQGEVSSAQEEEEDADIDEAFGQKVPEIGCVTPCAPVYIGNVRHCGARGVTRPTLRRNSKLDT